MAAGGHLTLYSFEPTILNHSSHAGIMAEPELRQHRPLRLSVGWRYLDRFDPSQVSSTCPTNVSRGYSSFGHCRRTALISFCCRSAINKSFVRAHALVDDEGDAENSYRAASTSVQRWSSVLRSSQTLSICRPAPASATFQSDADCSARWSFLSNLFTNVQHVRTTVEAVGYILSRQVSPLSRTVRSTAEGWPIYRNERANEEVYFWIIKKRHRKWRLILTQNHVANRHKTVVPL